MFGSRKQQTRRRSGANARVRASRAGIRAARVRCTTATKPDRQAASARCILNLWSIFSLLLPHCTTGRACGELGG